MTLNRVDYVRPGVSDWFVRSWSDEHYIDMTGFVEWQLHVTDLHMTATIEFTYPDCFEEIIPLCVL